jgi:hypothetical protein
MCEMEMPKYQSIKKVWGLKIKAIYEKETKKNEKSDGSMWISFEDERYGDRSIPFDYYKKHAPYAGGYFVVYKNGYESFSPAKEFEEGNIPVLDAEYNPALSFKDVSEDYQKRVCVEYDDLHGKIRSLKAYLSNKTDKDLELQLTFMSGYAVILGKRIEGFK